MRQTHRRPTRAEAFQVNLTLGEAPLEPAAIQVMQLPEVDCKETAKLEQLTIAVNRALQQWFSGVATVLIVWLCASSALAETSGSLSWGMGPLQTITSELSGAAGPVAVIALAAGGVGLMFGRDFGQLAHVASYIAIVAGMVGGVANLALGGALVG